MSKNINDNDKIHFHWVAGRNDGDLDRNHSEPIDAEDDVNNAGNYKLRTSANIETSIDELDVAIERHKHKCPAAVNLNDGIDTNITSSWNSISFDYNYNDIYIDSDKHHCNGCAWHLRDGARLSGDRWHRWWRCRDVVADCICHVDRYTSR
jgi:hypothetical protein